MYDVQILPKELGGQAELQSVQKFVAGLGPRHASRTGASANGVTFKDDDGPLQEVNYTPDLTNTGTQAGANSVPAANKTTLAGAR